MSNPAHRNQKILGRPETSSRRERTLAPLTAGWRCFNPWGGPTDPRSGLGFRLDMKVRYQAIAPLLAGEGSRAFLGLEINEAQKARPVVLIWAPEESASDESLKARLL